MKKKININKKNNKKKKNSLEVKKSTKPINKKKKNNNKYLKEIMEKRFNIIVFVMAILFIIIGGRLFYLQILNMEKL